jgi:MFS family permease
VIRAGCSSGFGLTSDRRSIWTNARTIPPGYRAVLDLLRFDRADAALLPSLSQREWGETLHRCDRTQLSLILLDRRRGSLPAFVAERLDASLARNRERTHRLEAAVAEILARLRSHALDPVLLKGFAHSPAFLADPALRVQYDLDLYLPENDALRAQKALRGLDYEPLEEMESFPTDHFPALVRKTGWQWRGDFYDPEAPLSIDLHYRLWDRDTEGFDAPGWQQFYERRIRSRSGALEFAALDAADSLAYAALHALRHLLRGSLRPFHVYEVAAFLEANAGDAALWERRLGRHEPALRLPQTVLFAIAERWFHCRLHPSLAEEIAALSAPIHDWLEAYAAAPVEGIFLPNKHELWLHLALLDSPGTARAVVIRRLFPVRMPGSVDPSVLLPAARITLRIRLRRAWRNALHVAVRVWHHTRVLPGVGVHAAGWWMRRAGMRPGFLRYLATSCLFSSGVFVFLLLYNLHLLALGFREDFLGRIASAATVGTIAGALPMGWLAHRFGVRAALMATIISVAIVSAMRAIAETPAALAAAAFAGGVAMSGWAVQFIPAVSQLTTSEGRTRGFSLFASVGIATGAVAGLIGGRLPGWISALAPALSELEARRSALLAASAIAAFALMPARLLRFPERPAAVAAKSYPSSPAFRSFLAALAVWHIATGAFNPFFNAWLVRRVHASTEAVGTIFSASQAVQVAALLAAPSILRRLGMIRGVSAMQGATALSLAACAFATNLPFASAAYIAYMSAQFMSEPGMFTLLTDRVPESQRSGASAIYFVTISITSALASLAAGAGYAAAGYTPVLLTAAAIAVLASLLLRRQSNS